MEAALSVQKSNPEDGVFSSKKQLLSAAFSVQKSNPEGGVFSSKKQLLSAAFSVQISNPKLRRHFQFIKAKKNYSINEHFTNDRNYITLTSE